ncbi:hypothetical protein Xmlh_00205 [Xanthomonas axonopodis pv. melhusii]|uniref:Uncharacterized protein n=1 Tax=Xanthomonas axonopodis pv. melhusii TaxID=487834 RepID=A0A1T1PBU7_9XANT|nr:hypothetical protein Xmlh_00205 [Xanthomonas axonopodis pv. melhusii]
MLINLLHHTLPPAIDIDQIGTRRLADTKIFSIFTSIHNQISVTLDNIERSQASCSFHTGTLG